MNKIKDSKYCNDFWDKISEEDRKKQGEMDLREEKIKKQEKNLLFMLWMH